MFDALSYGISGRAIKNKLIELSYYNPRNFTEDPHGRVDDRPYGGGPGMVLQAAPVIAAVEHAKKMLGSETPVIYLSPQGKRLTQQAINTLSQQSRLILLAGRYEGIDERAIELCVDESWSIGDYVLSGGELPAMVLLDALIRQLPEALGDADSAAEDSFSRGLLDCPHYTRPDDIHGKPVPAVLQSGDHAAIRRWRLKQALGCTWMLRRDLLETYEFTTEEHTLLNEFIEEWKGALK